MRARSGRHLERHRTGRVGWLRAAVLGANDGIVSTASLVLGVAAAAGSRGEVLTAGVAGLVAGAMSMAAGEYVSVSSQRDTEQADLERERGELERDPRPSTPSSRRSTSTAVSTPETARAGRRAADGARRALGAHARDELGVTEALAARPIQAAPRLRGQLRGRRGDAADRGRARARGVLIPIVGGASLVFLALLGALAARAGGAGVAVERRARRVLGRARDGDHGRRRSSLRS